MLTNDSRALIAIADGQEIFIRPEMLNRHGLIAGATGSGKTVSLQTLAETFSQMGIPVFMADVKGDLSGIAGSGAETGKPAKRARELRLEEKGFRFQGFPVRFWDCYGKGGHPLRATISEVGPLLLGRLLGLNDTQAGVLQLAFRIADDNGLLLLDLKDLRSMVQYVGDEREQFKSYGLVSPASVGAIQRGLLGLEQAGGDVFFGEPALDIMDLLSLRDGKGIVNVLDATALVNSPGLYSCVLLWLLSELYERLPEQGDQPLPRLVFFLDEAHLLFRDIKPELLGRIEQVARLIRSRGVGVFFVSQSPSDIPDSILGQLGNRIQHALRAFTPKDQKAVRAAAQAFRPNPAFQTAEAIGSLGVGEALVSFLDSGGAPEMVQKALIVPPQSQIGPIDGHEREELIGRDQAASRYDQAIDRESAYEILTARAGRLQAEKASAEWAKAREKARRELEKQARQAEKDQKREEKRLAAQARNDPLGGLLGNVARQTTRNVGAKLGRELGKSIFGNSVGGQIGATIARGLLGSLLGGRR
ncbi:MAG: DUF853 family protein [Desulfovibrio sp.]|nr:DUF853 family protein [Desulfovibrio sp.]